MCGSWLQRGIVKFPFVGDLNQSILWIPKSDPSQGPQDCLHGPSTHLVRAVGYWRKRSSHLDFCSTLLRVARKRGQPTVEFLKPLLIQYQKCPSSLTPHDRRANTWRYQKRCSLLLGHFNNYSASPAAEPPSFSPVEELALSWSLIEEAVTLRRVRQAT